MKCMRSNIRQILKRKQASWFMWIVNASLKEQQSGSPDNREDARDLGLRPCHLTHQQLPLGLAAQQQGISQNNG